MTRPSLEDLPYRARNLVRRLGVEALPSHAPDVNLLALHITRVFRRLAINVVLDVGAEVGTFGQWLRRNGYRGRIVSFEPVSDSFARLRQRSARDPLWDAFQMALGSLDGTAEMNVAASRLLSSFRARSAYSKEEFGEMSAIERTEPVPVRRLDGVIETALSGVREPRTYLKIDTQGWDLEVLAGASGCLDRIPAFQSEVSMRPLYEGMPSLTESLARFKELGYGISGLFPVAFDANLEVVEFDCVAVQRDAARRRL